MIYIPSFINIGSGIQKLIWGIHRHKDRKEIAQAYFQLTVRVPVGSKNFHFSISSRPALGFTQPPIKWVVGVKRQGREAHHSPPTSAEVKKMWIYTFTPLYVFMA
jgi:hypothetical protein